MKQYQDISRLSAKEIKSCQEENLDNLVRYLFENSPYYRRLFLENNIIPDDIRTLEDLIKIPVTVKKDIQQYNSDFLCVPEGQVAEYMSTSGTLGKPISIALTENDLLRLSYNEYMSFVCADSTREDIFQLMVTLDRQFMAGIAYYEGIRKLGATVVRIGPGLPVMQWDAIHRYRPTTLVAVPSFLIKLIEYAHANGIDPNASGVQKVICIGESLRTEKLELNRLGQRITESWNIKLYGTYASTEMQTAFTECSFGNGGHLNSELLIVEILDENNKPVQDGESGEVTITTLGVEAMPLLRYKTGDLARLHVSVCKCGRNTPRLGPVIGRKEQMIKLKGTTIFPAGIFDVIHQCAEVVDYTIEVLSDELGSDEMNIYIVSEESDSPATHEKLKSLFQSRLRVVPTIVTIDRKQLEQLQNNPANRKITRFIDNRR